MQTAESKFQKVPSFPRPHSYVTNPRTGQFSPVLFFPVFPVFPCFTSFPQLSPVFPSFPQFSPVFPSFPQFPLVFPSFPQFSPVFPSFPQFPQFSRLHSLFTNPRRVQDCSRDKCRHSVLSCTLGEALKKPKRL